METEISVHFSQSLSFHIQMNNTYSKYLTRKILKMLGFKKFSFAKHIFVFEDDNLKEQFKIFFKFHMEFNVLFSSFRPSVTHPLNVLILSVLLQILLK